MPTIRKHNQGRVIRVEQNEVLNKDHELAVQGHNDERVNGRSEDGPLALLLEPSPNELAERDAKRNK